MSEEMIDPDAVYCHDCDGLLVFDHWEKDGDTRESGIYIHVDVAIYKCSKCGQDVHEDAAISGGEFE
jgi:hypothetical protein